MSVIEERFMAWVDSIEAAETDQQPAILQVQDWWRAFSRFCREDGSVPHQGLRPAGELAHQLQGIGELLRSSEQRWVAQWQQLLPARSLASLLQDRIVLLVFGKFNAGKSSLCNFLADRFERQGRSVQHFRVADGRLVECAQRFEEGSVETTDVLQGVFLGNGLVLLDTPGLHSETMHHDALTRRFLESADGILWLSSATSPGQVQALEDLATELRRNKPLLPVLTRSDLVEEEERDGAIVKCLRNKTPEERAIQEEDVCERAKQKLQALGLSTELLKAPVSVSVSACRQHTDPPENRRLDMASALAASGFDRLYEALLALSAPAVAYRHRKPLEVLMHHLNEHVLADLEDRIMPAIASSRQALSQARQHLVHHQARIVALAWREVVPELPDLLAQHAGQEDRAALFGSVTALVQAAFGRQASEQLAEHALNCSDLSARLCVPSMDHERSHLEVEAAGAGGEDRAVAGLRPDDTDAVALYDTLQRAIHACLQAMASEIGQMCETTLERVDEDLQALQQRLTSDRDELLALIEGAMSADSGDGV